MVGDVDTTSSFHDDRRPSEFMDGIVTGLRLRSLVGQYRQEGGVARSLVAISPPANGRTALAGPSGARLEPSE
jgi:hypothetical protein